MNKKQYIAPAMQMHIIAVDAILAAVSGTDNIQNAPLHGEEETTTPGARPNGSSMWD